MTGPVWEQVTQTAADVLGVERASLDEHSGPEKIESWDSVQHLNLMLALESHFSLQFDPDEMDKMTTLGKITQVIQAHAGSASSS